MIGNAFTRPYNTHGYGNALTVRVSSLQTGNETRPFRHDLVPRLPHRPARRNTS